MHKIIEAVKPKNFGAKPVLDLYREVHKGVRSALFDLCRSAGSLDQHDASERQAFIARFVDLCSLAG